MPNIATISGNLLTDSAVDLATLPSGSGTTNYLPKWATSTSLGNSLIFDNGTQIGINTATPTSGFTLDNNGSFRNFREAAFLMNTGEAGGGNGAIGIGVLPGSVSRISGQRLIEINSYYSTFRITDGTHRAEFGMGVPTVPYIGTTTNRDFDISTNNASRIRVFANGNVAVGRTTDNGVRFQVQGDASATGAISCQSIQTGQIASNNTLFVNGIVPNSTNLLFTADISNSRTFKFATNSSISTSVNPITFYEGNSIIGIGTSDVNLLLINPTINQATGTGRIYGYRFNPTNTAVLSAVYSFYADSGIAYFSDNVGIGTNAPAYKLDITGATRATNLLLNSTINYGGAINVNNWAFKVENDGSFGNHFSGNNQGYGVMYNTNWNLAGTGPQITKQSSTNGAFTNDLIIINSNSSVRINPSGINYTSQPVIIGNQASTGEKLQVDGTMRVVNGASLATSSGNVLIGTTTDAGEKLQVQGSLRVGAASAGNWTSATFNVANGTGLVINGGGGGGGNDAMFLVYNRAYDNTVNFSVTYNRAIHRSELQAPYLRATSDSASLGVVIGTTAASQISNYHDQTIPTGAYNQRYVTGMIHFNGFFIATNDGGTNPWFGYTNVGSKSFLNANLMVGANASTAINASAQLQVESTTKGFLPPRMTAVQAEAIATPAEGLMVYATTGTGVTITSKGWWGYDGAAWVKLN